MRLTLSCQARVGSTLGRLAAPPLPGARVPLRFPFDAAHSSGSFLKCQTTAFMHQCGDRDPLDSSQCSPESRRRL